MKLFSLITYSVILSNTAFAQVAIGTNVPEANTQLTVKGSTTSTGIKASAGYPSTSLLVNPGVYGESTLSPGVVGVSESHYGVQGISTANAFAGLMGGNSAPNGYGVHGQVTNTGIAGFFDGGINGRGIIVTNGANGFGTDAPNGRLVVTQGGTSGVDTAAAIYGYSNSTLSCYKGGVFGTYNPDNYGTGVQGIGYQGILLSNAPAQFPSLSSSTDMGVYGSGNGAGVIGASISGNGLRGYSTTSNGVVGYSQSGSTGAGVSGLGHTVGLMGTATNIGSGTVPNIRYGIYAQASGAATNWAGYFNGNVNIVGSIAKGSGTFKIDHPLDPENKYLYHSFVESPDMMNIYNGNIATDGQGYATVKLPDYFDALNKEFRYQLTVIGTFAQAIIKEEISGNSFKIQTNQPNIKVSWQVTGVRKDKFAEAHRIMPEVEKEKENKGRYVHAAEWGKPANKEINYEINHPAQPERKK